MPRPRGNGLVTKRRTLADGTVREYCYNRYTGEKLGNSAEIAQQRLAELPPTSEVGTIHALCTAYQRTEKFKKKAAGTQAIYRRTMDQIRERFGDLQVKRVRASFAESLKLDLQDQPSKANNTLRMLRILFSLAVRLGECPSNPFAKFGQLEEPARTEIWTVEAEEKFLAIARPSLQLAFMLLLYTVQRPSDMLAMTRNRVSERNGRLFIALRQKKTDTLLDVPVHGRLAPLLRERLANPEGGLLLVASPTGRPWPRRNFSRAWDQAMKRAGLMGELQRRDLRRTGVVRMAQAGATTPMIAAVTGHGIDYTQRIIETYLPRRTEVALAGIEAWEQRSAEPLTKVIQLAAERQKGRRT